MQISSLIDIVGGYLLNSPSISFITQTHTNPTKVNEGDLFIASNQDEIYIAIDNGAFAIICDFHPDICDREIAWIKVDSINNAIAKILRFSFSNKSNLGYYCDSISFELIELLSLPKSYCLLVDDYKENFELLKEVDETTIIVSKDELFLSKVLPSFKTIVKKDFEIDNVTIHSMFSTSFSYSGKFFYKLKLPSLYINHFLTVLEFLDNSKDFNILKNFKYLNPIFLNKEFDIVSFGETNKFIIANDDLSLVDNEIQYLKQNYKYGKIEVLDESLSLNDVLFKLQTLDYNALYIKGKNVNELHHCLKVNSENDAVLFD